MLTITETDIQAANAARHAKTTGPDDSGIFISRVCPLAQALNRTYGGQFSTGALWAYRLDSLGRRRAHTGKEVFTRPRAVIVYPPPLRAWLRAWDDGLTVQPAEFEV